MSSYKLLHPVSTAPPLMNLDLQQVGAIRMYVTRASTEASAAPTTKIITYTMPTTASTTLVTIPVSVNKNTPPENNTHWNVSFQSTISGAGEQFLLWDCRARACAKKECLLHRHR